MISSNLNTASSRTGYVPVRAPIQSRTKSIYEHVIVVTRKTELEELTARFNTVAQARFYLERAGRDLEPIIQEHERYQMALDKVRHVIPTNVKSQVIDRQYVPQFTFGEDDIVITVGQDGLVVNTAKYLTQQPIIGVNPDPRKVEGALLPFTTKKLADKLSDTLQGHAQIQDVTMAKTVLNDGQELLAFNDLFVGPRSHTSARYHIEQAGQGEDQSSSGIIISTGAGSTGWMKSIYAGAAGIIKALGGEVSMPKEGSRFEWDADYLIYAVREPWPSKTSKSNMVFGVITPEQPLVLNSYMAEHGVIFSDGIENDYVKFNAGHSATIKIAENKARLIL
jgi:NAD kinase